MMKDDKVTLLLLVNLLTLSNIVDGALHHVCGSLPPLQNGRIVYINAEVRKYVCKRGFALARKSLRYRRCDPSGWIPKHAAECLDKNECITSSNSKFPCHKNAICVNNIGSYTCICRSGYYGNGKKCSAYVNKLEEYLSKDDKCGVVSVNMTTRFRRIVSGGKSSPGEWPWQVLITVREGVIPVFSGVLIKPGWVLTSANPLRSLKGRLKAHHILVTLGEYDRNKPENEEQHFGVKNVYLHPRFNKTVSLENDIALLQLNGEAQITEYVNTVCMSDSKSVRKLEKGYRIAHISGWGLTKAISLLEFFQHSGSTRLFSRVLEDVDVPLLPPYRCRGGTSYFYNKKTMICTYNRHDKKSPCLGDNGAPLTIKDPITDRWLLLGLYSWSEGCGQLDRYSFYTRVTKYKNWISELTKQNNNDI